MKQQKCKLCDSIYHTKFKCPKSVEAIAKHQETKRKMTEKQIAKQSIKKAPKKEEAHNARCER